MPRVLLLLASACAPIAVVDVSGDTPFAPVRDAFCTTATDFIPTAVVFSTSAADVAHHEELAEKQDRLLALEYDYQASACGELRDLMREIGRLLPPSADAQSLALTTLPPTLEAVDGDVSGVLRRFDRNPYARWADDLEDCPADEDAFWAVARGWGAEDETFGVHVIRGRVAVAADGASASVEIEEAELLRTTTGEAELTMSVSATLADCGR